MAHRLASLLSDRFEGGTPLTTTELIARETARTSDARVLVPEALEDLLTALHDRGYRVLGPQLRAGTIVYGELTRAADLPTGWTAEQEPGHYRLARRNDEARFGYTPGPHSWKQELFPARVRLFSSKRTGADLELTEEPLDERPTALVGVRACEVAAIRIQDRVFLGGRFADRDYAARRRELFVVAVDCGEPAATCFCDSVGAGPSAEHDFDLRLTELLDGEHRLLAVAGSAAGAELLGALPARAASDDDLAAADQLREQARATMRAGAELQVEGLHDLLVENPEHPRWDDVAKRCLGCANCTLVCPTCFCSSVEDVADLTGTEAERFRVWDSCFSVKYSELHGGSVRTSTKSRYRQWLTHKLGTWQDQFGELGCVGCGRCITWCPAGIDLREEVNALQEVQAQ